MKKWKWQNLVMAILLCFGQHLYSYSSELCRLFIIFIWHSIFGKEVKWVLEIQVAVNPIMEKEGHYAYGLQFARSNIWGMLCIWISCKRGKMHWLLYISKVGLVFLPPQTTRSVGTGYNHPSWDQMLPREKWSGCNKSDDLSFLNEPFILVFFLACRFDLFIVADWSWLDC